MTHSQAQGNKDNLIGSFDIGNGKFFDLCIVSLVTEIIHLQFICSTKHTMYCLGYSADFLHEMLNENVTHVRTAYKTKTAPAVTYHHWHKKAVCCSLVFYGNSRKYEKLLFPWVWPHQHTVYKCAMQACSLNNTIATCRPCPLNVFMKQCAHLLACWHSRRL